jgi:hypothetical protein
MTSTVIVVGVMPTSVAWRGVLPHLLLDAAAVLAVVDDDADEPLLVLLREHADATTQAVSARPSQSLLFTGPPWILRANRTRAAT